MGLILLPFVRKTGRIINAIIFLREIFESKFQLNKGELQYLTLGPVFDREEIARLLAGPPDESDPLWRRV